MKLKTPEVWLKIDFDEVDTRLVILSPVDFGFKYEMSRAAFLERVCDDPRFGLCPKGASDLIRVRYTTQRRGSLLRVAEGTHLSYTSFVLKVVCEGLPKQKALKRVVVPYDFNTCDHLLAKWVFTLKG